MAGKSQKRAEPAPAHLRRSCAGLLAHVDAGKTTLSEALLYLSGAVRTLGRVDHRNTVLDTDVLERERGITIFSKQALLTHGTLSLTLVDTPGHADFSAEAERTLQILDFAIVVISGTDGVQAHTETLWQLLQRYRLPVFFFVTKMDLVSANQAEVLQSLQSRLSENILLCAPEPDPEELAMCSETLLERHLDQGITTQDICAAIRRREVFPCFFGSGLKLDGVDVFLDALDRYAPVPDYPDVFSARVYKITHDASGARLTHLKVTGGTLSVRDQIQNQKITQIRTYSGARSTSVPSVPAGTLCAVQGLEDSFPGQGLGAVDNAPLPLLHPVLSYKLRLPPDYDPLTALSKLRQLEEEEPQLQVLWHSALREIHVQLMGQVQIEILQRVLADRYDLPVHFDEGRILYRETIAPGDLVEGVGHYEPLRHYAEVHLLLEPLDEGSGLIYTSVCPEDVLDRNWQRLILTHLAEKRHVGVLTGSPITDIKITLTNGRAHLKHTEGGDFRQATYRAVRQGLMQAHSVLLEPWYYFTLDLPPEQSGRAMTDLRSMNGVFDTPTDDGHGLTRLEGMAPVSTMRGYGATVTAYTGGRGRLSLRPGPYKPCQNTEKVVQALGYDPVRDLDNSPDSIFCAHGSGFPVRWDQVPRYMHLDSTLPRSHVQTTRPLRPLSIDDAELEAILRREFGPDRPRIPSSGTAKSAPVQIKELPRKQLVIVDGYNVIFAWDELKRLSQDNLSAARHKLLDILSNYCHFTGCELIVVFDAYRVEGGAGSKFDRGGLHVVYTQENETADTYIEKLTHEIGRNYAVRVVTSDALIQLSALHAGVLRISNREFHYDVELAYEQMEEILRKSNDGAHQTAIDWSKSGNNL